MMAMATYATCVCVCVRNHVIARHSYIPCDHDGKWHQF